MKVDGIYTQTSLRPRLEYLHTWAFDGGQPCLHPDVVFIKKGFDVVAAFSWATCDKIVYTVSLFDPRDSSQYWNEITEAHPPMTIKVASYDITHLKGCTAFLYSLFFIADILTKRVSQECLMQSSLPTSFLWLLSPWHLKFWKCERKV